jgi:hypothetical protein
MDAVRFFDFLSQYFKDLKLRHVNGPCIYRTIDTGREVFAELKPDGKIIIGYKGIHKAGEKMAAILNRPHFDEYFSHLVDAEEGKMYKEYVPRHKASGDPGGMTNLIEAIFISNSLSELEGEYMKQAIGETKK